MGKYIEAEAVAAELLFERLIGYKYALSTLTEVHTFGKKTGSQIQLKQLPVSIVAVDGFLKYKELLFENWVNVPIQNICQMGRVLDIPPSIFQVPFETVRVIYLAGETEIPEEIKKAVQEIADLLIDEDLNEWNLPLSNSTVAVIDKYRK